MSEIPTSRQTEAEDNRVQDVNEAFDQANEQDAKINADTDKLILAFRSASYEQKEEMVKSLSEVSGYIDSGAFAYELSQTRTGLGLMAENPEKFPGLGDSIIVAAVNSDLRIRDRFSGKRGLVVENLDKYSDVSNQTANFLIDSIDKLHRAGSVGVEKACMKLVANSEIVPYLKEDPELLETVVENAVKGIKALKQRADMTPEEQAKVALRSADPEISTIILNKLGYGETQTAA